MNTFLDERAKKGEAFRKTVIRPSKQLDNSLSALQTSIFLGNIYLSVPSDQSMALCFWCSRNLFLLSHELFPLHSNPFNYHLGWRFLQVVKLKLQYSWSCFPNCLSFIWRKTNMDSVRRYQSFNYENAVNEGTHLRLSWLSLLLNFSIRCSSIHLNHAKSWTEMKAAYNSHLLI